MNGAWKKNENSPTALNKSQTETEKKKQKNTYLLKQRTSFQLNGYEKCSDN